MPWLFSWSLAGTSSKVGRENEKKSLLSFIKRKICLLGTKVISFNFTQCQVSMTCALISFCDYIRPPSNNTSAWIIARKPWQIFLLFSIVAQISQLAANFHILRVNIWINLIQGWYLCQQKNIIYTHCTLEKKAAMWLRVDSMFPQYSTFFNLHAHLIFFQKSKIKRQTTYARPPSRNLSERCIAWAPIIRWNKLKKC